MEISVLIVWEENVKNPLGFYNLQWSIYICASC
jgi:hypothetical protein